MEIRQLHIFREVARNLNFTQAARTLNYAQSNVTTQIQALETELNVRLFERLGKRVVLTQPGQQLLGYAEKVLHLIDEALSVVPAGNEPSGTLIVGASETVCIYRLPPVLARFRSLCPRVQLRFWPLTCEGLRSALAEGVIDVAFLLEKPVQDEMLAVEQLTAETLVLVSAPDHRLALGSQVSITELRRETILLTEVGCSYRDLFEQLLQREAVHPETSITFANVEAIKQCAMAGIGIACLPAVSVSAELAAGRLARIPLADQALAGTLGTQMVWHKDKWLTPALRTFIEVTRSLLSGTTI